MGLIRTCGRYLKAVFLQMTGGIEKTRKELLRNPHVMRASYDEIIQEEEQQIRQYKDVIGDQARRQEEKLMTLRKLTAEVEDLEKHGQGAGYLGQEVTAKLQAQGKSEAEIEQDPEWQYYFNHFNLCDSAVTEKSKRIAELEDDVEQLAKSIADNEQTLKLKILKLSQLKDEANDAIVDVIAAKQEQEKADTVIGINSSAHLKQLQEMREVRLKARADARVSVRLSGLDTERQRQQFLEFANAGYAKQQFKQLVGMKTPQIKESSKIEEVK